jgi:magnesium and cobalt exporter, CNNM family
MDEQRAVYWIILFFCLIFSFLFAMCETAFLSLQRIRMKHLERTEVAQADLVAKIMKKPEKFISGVLLGNNVVNCTAAALATAIAISLWRSNESMAVLVGTIIVTFVVLIFGEITPKTIATRHSEQIALALARPVEVFLWVLTPVLTVLSTIASAVGKVTGGTSGSKTVVAVTEDEIRTMISVGQAEGVIAEAQAEMLHNIFEFEDQPVSIAMTPRPDVVWVEQGSTLREFLNVYSKSPYSRFPVYREEIDNVVGLLSSKDVLMAQAKHTIEETDTIDGLVRPVMLIPESKRLGEAFAEMRAGDNRIAVAVDEFGTIVGLVTLEQLLEEIVGQLGDEIRGSPKDFETIDEHTFDVDGGMRVDEVNEELGLKLPEGDYETVAGFMLTRLGRIPKEYDQIKYGNLRLVVTKMRGLRIESMRIIREASHNGARADG